MLQQKLSILLQHAVIDQVIYDGLQRIVHDLLANQIVTNEDASETFLIHLAMAASRQGKSEVPVAKMDATLSIEITEDPHYDEVVQVWERLALLIPISFHQNELDYLYLHLLAILSANNET
ncbi:PRD domain-containing protein [Entomospira culicis]|uniref:PRD domain-containing protein n=1 Tax=Entomospira culicis TaxID=2719989 RepID=A0A968GGQ1_9SPIO|nr:PRD domain-containing protein [Entomospira culicis]NIZ19584.1 PRD domain-containing protein [Entomospira culicis]NIZ69511.1 PRD domain-containing protein [Entomospira culicis]WDI36626.1 PRD domain-containing protein [Entomospira culicis]WDI38254.1 PRD domain-containing protein [Entomospira culicis]